jgi:hypothetical protein
MAITTTAMTLGPDAGDDEWGVFFYTADASGCEDIKAAPGVGNYLYIDEIWMRTNAAIDIDIGDGEDSSAVETKLFPLLIGPIKMFGQRLTVNKALTIDASAGGVINGYAIGRTGRAFTAFKDR